MTRRRPARTDGYAPLRDYLGIGDGRSIALVAADGTIDWWPVPDLDSAPVFAALLDPAGGGSIALAPREPFTVERRYVGDTNVAETVFTTDSGSVRVTDSLNSGLAGRLPWNELARRVECVDGTVELAWHVTPGSALGTLTPWAVDGDRGPLLHLDDLMLSVRTTGLGDPTVEDRSVHGSVTLRAGDRGLLGVVAAHDEPLHLPDTDAVDRRIDRTLDSWQAWSDNFTWDGPWGDAVLRSALTLKLLLHSPTGSIAAAATTSLPERIGGDKNWDYRYTWTRDTAYTLDAFIRCGLDEEVHAAAAWLLGTVRRHGPRPRPFYTLAGDLPGEHEFRDVPGYRGSRPVVDGNAAKMQLQVGPYGDLFQTLYLIARETHVLDPGTQRLLAELADRCCDDWQRRDAGMWELHDDQHFTISKISCWQALDRAARLVDEGLMPGNAQRWRAEAQRIRAWVQEYCWSERRQAYVMHPGTDALDAGILLGARFGFDRGERMARTLDAVCRELAEGPWFYRYTGMQQEEGAFLACTFWAVEALAFTGRRDAACRLMDAALTQLADAPLLAEMIDPATGDMLGNLPQALSHLALINAACAVQETA